MGRTEERQQSEEHSVDFDTASLAFDDPMQLTTQDREVAGEARWLTIGFASGVLSLSVAHTLEDEDDEVIRIISARKAEPHERRIYERGH